MTEFHTTSADAAGFFAGNAPDALLAAYGSPLYVYNETILRERCREMRSLCDYKNFRVNYSAKANANVSLLRIIREEGLDADAMSPGEILAEFKAGFPPERIFFISNNVSAEEMRLAAERGVKISVDSLSQLETLGKALPGASAAVRINPGIGAGHHASVVTGGKNTKFGVNMEDLPALNAVTKKYGLKIVGLNAHIGSLFMEPSSYIQAAKILTDFAGNFGDLEFVDFGGGFGIPYRKREGEGRLDLNDLGRRLSEVVKTLISAYGAELTVKIEPGRYIVSECGALLGTVHALKENGGVRYVGTDIGMTTLMRPVLYGSHHDIEAFRASGPEFSGRRRVTVVGNICETGDVLARDIELPALKPGDMLCVRDAGAYGYVMASAYNQRPRPAEVLIRAGGSPELIRRRETWDDLLAYVN